MNKFFTLLLSCLFTLSLSAQKNFLEENFANLLEEENTTRVSVGKRMFEIAAKVTEDATDEDTKEVNKFVSKIKSFDLITTKSTDPKAAFKKGLAKCANYEELVRVKTEDANISIRIKESSTDVIEEIIGLIAADSEFVAFTLVGQIDLNEVNKLINKIQEKEMSKILKTAKVSIDDAKVYPNPIKSGEKVNVEIPQNLMGGKLTVIDQTGKIINTYNITENRMEINTTNLKNNSYIIKMEKGDVFISKKLMTIE